MKFDPIKPAPPVTRIVFSILAFGSSRARSRLLSLAVELPIVNKKDGNPRPLGGACGFVRTLVFCVYARNLLIPRCVEAPAPHLEPARSPFWAEYPSIPNLTFPNRPARCLLRSWAIDNGRERGASPLFQRPLAPRDSQSRTAGDPQGR